MVNQKTVIDAHCHIYPDMIAEKAANATGAFYGGKPACSGTVNRLIQKCEKCGIDRCIVQSVATTPHQVKSINEFISSTVSLHSDILTGFGTLHPDSGDISGDLNHLIELGLKGVKLHPDIQGFKIDDYRCLKIYELCEEYGLPVLMHTGDKRYDFSNPNRLIPILEIYSNLTVIGAHFGGYTIWDEASKEICSSLKLNNFYVDCSSSLAFLTPEKAKEIILRYGADRVLFGTDYPMNDPENELKLFFNLSLSECEQKMILSENAKRILKL